MGTKHRNYPPEFKERIVEDVLYRAKSVTKVGREHDMAPIVIYRWIKAYQQGKLTDSNGRRNSKKGTIEDLEALAGRLMIDNELLKKALQEVQKPAKQNEIISTPIEVGLEP